MFHNIVPDNISKTLEIPPHNLKTSEFLKIIKIVNKLFKIISLKDYVENYIKRGRFPYSKCAITFDDGTASSLENGIQFLCRKNIPVTIFISTCQIHNKKILDGYYLAALCLESKYESIQIENYTFPLKTFTQKVYTYKKLQKIVNHKSKDQLIENLINSYPVMGESIKFYRGLTKYEIEANLEKFSCLNIASHSNNHYSLEEMDFDTQYKEIKDSLDIISSLNGTNKLYFSYPYGEYNNDTLKVLTSLGLSASFAVKPKNLNINKAFEIERIGIYKSNFLYVLAKILKYQLRI
ncbi:MAG: polysaccharide deacetylase family protein [Prochlorococcus marinus CUG1435]|nr:polysaccharide deacetylase family protein [Prochlorococcus marinus CUG1435]